MNSRSQWRQYAKAVTAIALAALSGCSTTQSVQHVDERVLEGLYLRGVFSWWEADEEFRLEPIDSLLFKASLSLIADGQPYDFRIGDKDWTPGLTCGLQQGEPEEIRLGRKTDADCRDGSRNFKFLPKETGQYEVLVDFSDDPYEPTLTIRKR